MRHNKQTQTQPEIELMSVEASVLQRRWRSLMNCPAPAALPQSLMIRILSWKDQTIISGELDAKARDDLANSLKNTASDRASQTKPNPIRIKPGTLFTREHAGVLHRVMAVETGFAWNGRTFASLSAVARAITGTHWNGKRFFGLTQAQVQAQTKAQTKAQAQTKSTSSNGKMSSLTKKSSAPPQILSPARNEAEP